MWTLRYDFTARVKHTAKIVASRPMCFQFDTDSVLL